MSKSIREHIDHELENVERVSQAILQALQGYVTPFQSLPPDTKFGIRDPSGQVSDSVHAIGEIAYAAGSEYFQDMHVVDGQKQRFTFTPANIGEAIVPAVLIQEA